MPIQLMPGEVTPTLFVGLGGSGGRAISRIAGRLRSSRDWELKYRDLVRFVGIDTNAADLAKLREGRGRMGHVDATMTIADFDKVEFTKLRRGEAFADADPYFTQWVHPWYRFREESGAGAGQIRIESRLGFFRSVEVGEVTRQLQDVLAGMMSHGHGMRRHGAPLQVFVYFSVAGGTGSGAFLPFAYLLRDLIGDKRARLFGFAILPDAFEDKVGMNRDGTLANGYAALKELEQLMRLDAQAPPNSLTFHYDPRNKSRTTVDRRPFDLVYLVDRPERFSIDNVGGALADATYVQIFSPILGEQQGDYDNYTKESRALFPEELGDDGYTAFFGTLGSSVLLLPREDLLGYCARRYAATAVRRYLLLDDPALVSDAQKERFKQFQVDRDELDALAPEAQAERIDESFQQKMDLLAEQDREGGVWKRLITIRQSAGEKLQDTLKQLEDELRGLCSGVREISADRILDDQWTPATTVNSLSREMAAARTNVDARVATVLKQLEAGDWWSEFLAKAGPDAAPELNPYEQRYALIHFRKGGGPLDPAQADAIASTVARLRTEADLSRESRFRSEMDAHAAEIKRTYGGWDKLITRKDKDFEAARDRTVGTFNEFVDKARALLVKAAMHEIVVALGRGADAMRASFRHIESSAGRLASELEEKARRFEYDGGELSSQANDFLLDVEVLQHPSGRQRFWQWYYADQVETRPETSDQGEVLGAVREALRPRFDDRGRPVKRSAREMISDIESALIDVATRFLGKQILGDAESDDPYEQAGLRLDDALVLEARYYGLYTDNPNADPKTALRDLAPLSASDLRKQDAIGRYVRRKLDAALGKAQPLTRFNPEAKSMLKHADMLLIGLHESLARGDLGTQLEEATYGKGHETIADWPDPDRVVFYHSILGVPVYCFPHINEEMKHAYQRFQAQKERAYPLHIDHHWEGLQDLDPTAARAAKQGEQERLRVGVGAIALGSESGAIAHDGTWKLVLEGATLDLAEGIVAAAKRLLSLEEDKPAVYDMAVAPLVADARKAAGSSALKATLQNAQSSWAKRCVALELGDRDAAQEREYQELRRASALLKDLLG
ncbi:MAG: tubulin-like doman-containing protein [Myxococcota bacterium]